MPEDASPVVLGTLGLSVIAVAVFWPWTAYYMSVVQFTAVKSLAVLTGVRKYSIAFIGKDGRYTLAGYAVFTEGWWLSKLAVALVAVPAPSVAGLLLARGVEVGWDPQIMLATLLLLLIIPALHNETWASLLLLVALALVLGLFVYRASVEAQLGAVIALAWLLLLGGLGWVIAHAGRPASVGNTAVDALEDLTAVPDELWTLLFLLISISALVAGARWLLY